MSSTSTEKISHASNFQGRSAFHRINFLYQACNLVNGVPGKAQRILNAHYGQLLSKVAKKSVLRMDPSIKRTICKGCGSFLEAGVSTKIRKKRKNKGTIKSTCLTCGTLKNFGARKDYKIWHSKEESIHTLIIDKSQAQASSKNAVKRKLDEIK